VGFLWALMYLTRSESCKFVILGFVICSIMRLTCLTHINTFSNTLLGKTFKTISDVAGCERYEAYFSYFLPIENVEMDLIVIKNLGKDL
jgi:hypothetical protein